MIIKLNGEQQRCCQDTERLDKAWVLKVFDKGFHPA